MGKPSINGPFSMAMLNNQMVYIFIYMNVYRCILYIMRRGEIVVVLLVRMALVTSPSYW